MRLDHTFTVPVPVDEAWRVLLDVPRVAPCMPGAALGDFDGDEFTGTVKVKIGPIVLMYKGKGRFVERDEAARRVVVEASGRDARAAGTAAATVTAILIPDGDATRVTVATDLTVTGRPAQFGRGLLADVGGRLIGQFADCLADQLSAPAFPPPEVQPAPPAASASSDAISAAGAGAVSAAGATSAAAVPSDAAPSVSAGLSDGAPSVSAEAEVEPVDLLRLTAGATAARYAGLVALAGAAALVTWLVIRALRPRV